LLKKETTQRMSLQQDAQLGRAGGLQRAQKKNGVGVNRRIEFQVLGIEVEECCSVVTRVLFLVLSCRDGGPWGR
jgi:hypothetical protein